MIIKDEQKKRIKEYKETLKVKQKDLTQKAIEKEPSTKVGKVILKNSRTILTTLGAMVIVMILIAMGASVVEKTHPAVIKLDGEPLCYLSSEKDAEAAVRKVAEDYKYIDTKITAVDTEGRLTVEKTENFNVDEKKASLREAIALVRSETEKSSDDQLQMQVVSSSISVEPYEPEPNYEKDDTMLAGESKVIKKGKKGIQDQATIYTTNNGKLVDTKKVTVSVKDEGEKATVAKGTLGLPDGEDWRTYTGDPVYKDGADLVTTSMHYLGAPYKYGGKSLTHGIDCVWFVVRMYEKYGINLRASHGGIRKRGKGVSLANAQKGDIVCYSHHMGIYVGDGKMIEATSRHGVRVGKVKASRVVTIRRVVE